MQGGIEGKENPLESSTFTKGHGGESTRAPEVLLLTRWKNKKQNKQKYNASIKLIQLNRARIDGRICPLISIY